jgi:hypothetical protein
VRSRAAIYDFGVHDGGVFLAMEYIEGVTLRASVGEYPSLRTQLDGVEGWLLAL